MDEVIETRRKAEAQPSNYIMYTYSLMSAEELETL